MTTAWMQETSILEHAEVHSAHAFKHCLNQCPKNAALQKASQVNEAMAALWWQSFTEVLNVTLSMYLCPPDKSKAPKKASQDWQEASGKNATFMPSFESWAIVCKGQGMGNFVREQDKKWNALSLWLLLNEPKWPASCVCTAASSRCSKHDCQLFFHQVAQLSGIRVNTDQGYLLAPLIMKHSSPAIMNAVLMLKEMLILPLAMKLRQSLLLKTGSNIYMVESVKQPLNWNFSVSQKIRWNVDGTFIGTVTGYDLPPVQTDGSADNCTLVFKTFLEAPLLR
ncbi:hypothetical protein EDC04DRAFT_2611768 [Pisolithus marmoratus]|nr:hypothetical protein EDC04DRAFT_2611768 [Pisolithus marmoratus]